MPTNANERHFYGGTLNTSRGQFFLHTEREIGLL